MEPALVQLLVGSQGASFELNGQTYHLEANNGANCNHSGSTGWDSALFSVESVTDQEITLYTERADGTGGFPKSQDLGDLWLDGSRGVGNQLSSRNGPRYAS